MNKLVIAAASTLGLMLTGSPAIAADPVVDTCGWSGVIGVYGELGSTSGEYDGKGKGIGAYAKSNICDLFGTGLNLQSDYYGATTKASSGDFEDYKSTTFGSVSHLYYRDDGMALGILAGSGKLYDTYWDGYDFDLIGVVGADAQLYLDQVTLAGQFAYWHVLGGSSDNGGQTESAYQVSGEARYFATDNLKLSGRLAYDWSEGEEYCTCVWKAVSFGGGAEYQFDSSPISLFANYTRIEGTIDGYNMDDNVFKAGLAVHINSNSLLSEDRHGASFSTPMIDNWSNLSVAYWR